MKSTREIRIDDLRGPEIRELLAEHLRCSAEVSPPQSMHALDLEGLRNANVAWGSAWEGGQLAGCGALKELDGARGEIKSMRTVKSYARQGVASMILQHI